MLQIFGDFLEIISLFEKYNIQIDSYLIAWSDSRWKQNWVYP